MKKVTIYSTPTCAYCGKAKQFFKEHDVAFEEINVAADAEKRAEMIDLTGQMGVPVIKIDDQVLVGYDQKTLIEMLGLPVKA